MISATAPGAEPGVHQRRHDIGARFRTSAHSCTALHRIMSLSRSTTHRLARPAAARTSRQRVRSWTGRAVVSSATDTPLPRSASANTHRTRVSEIRLAGRPGRCFDAKRQPAPVTPYRAHGYRQVLFAIEESR